MAMTDEELYAVTREWVGRIFVQPGATATSGVDQLKAALQKIDQAMGATGNQIVSAGYGTTVLEQAILAECRSVAPNLTAQQAGIALALWTMKRVDL